MALAAQGVSARQIGRLLGRAHTTISRELRHGRNGEWAYRATNAQRMVHHSTRRPKPARLLQSGALRERVLRDLLDGFSPEQIAGQSDGSSPNSQPCGSPTRRYTRPSTGTGPASSPELTDR